jgi:hypothetical protein
VRNVSESGPRQVPRSDFLNFGRRWTRLGLKSLRFTESFRNGGDSPARTSLKISVGVDGLGRFQFDSATTEETSQDVCCGTRDDAFSETRRTAKRRRLSEQQGRR